MFKVIIFVITIIASTSLSAAEFFMLKTGPDSFQIQLSGLIKDGDYERLVSLIENSPVSFLGSPSIALSSRGGSVAEAIKIGGLVEKASLMTVVNKNEICASSCFLIFIAGNMRLTDGSVLIHRPYVAGGSYSKDEVDEAGEKQRASVKLVRQYLEMRSVHSDIVNKMLSLSSSKAYQLTDDDLWSLGLISPWFEEAAIAKCGASSEMLLNQKLITPKIKSCVSGLSDVSRAKLIIGILGEKRGVSAVREYVDFKTHQ